MTSYFRQEVEIWQFRAFAMKKYAIWPLLMAESPLNPAIGHIPCSTERISCYVMLFDVARVSLVLCAYPAFVPGLAVDSVHNKLFFTMMREGRIVEVSLEENRLVIRTDSNSEPVSIVVDEENR